MFFLNELRRWNKNQTAMRALKSMSDRELRDLGIARGEIKARVKGLSR